jgi:hypothetical protein
MSDSETQSDYKIIETQINLMEDMLDNYIEKGLGATSLKDALNIVLKLAEGTMPDLSKAITDDPKCLKTSDAITKVKNFIEQL